MSERSPEFIYFDLGNVLLTFDHGIACRQIAALTGLSAERVNGLVFESGLQLQYERGELTSREFYDTFCRVAGVQPDYDALHHANSAMFDLNVPVVPIVAQLWAAGYRMGILSNTCEAHWNYVSQGRYAVVTEFFQRHVLSHEVRCTKPDLAIFQRAAQQAGVLPERIFFVDDRQENVDGARRAGWDAVLFQGPQQLGEDLRARGVRFNY
jgi:putative hydrolase of the HAD superfamily